MKNDPKKMNEEEKAKQSAFMEQYLLEAQENNILRAHSRHSMRLGRIELDIIPTDKTQSLEDVMKQFAGFAKLMNELHGDAHLSDENKIGNMSGMFE